MDMSGFKPGQRNAITYLKGPLLICAGAGSGKTFTLTQRIAYSLLPESGENGKPFLESIDQALIITYTNKAAGEIKDRVRQTLRKEGLLEESLKVDAAWISTIHGMCSRILREHALELGIDPAFKLIMGDEQSRMLTQATENVLTRIKANGEARFNALFEAYKVEDVHNMLESILGMAANQTEGLHAFNLGPTETDAGALARELLGLCDDLQVAGTDKNKEEAEKLSDALQDMLASGAASSETLAEILGGVKKGSLSGKKATDLKAAVNTYQNLCRCDALVPHLEALLELAWQIDAEYHDLLSAQALIDTGDLIRTTLRAFREHPNIAREYTERFRLIMVDEFQDTSQLQIDMIEQIAGAQKTHLCTVGDSQQSIYRFQGADVEVYLRHKQDMLGLSPVAAHREELGDNFRSHGDVLAFVRAICGKKGYFPEEFLDLQAATPGRSWHGSGPRIEVVLTEFAYRTCKTTQAREAEARHIASRFKELAEAGHSPSEMVILMGSTTDANIYAQAVRDAGMECIIAGGSKFFESDHVKVCQRLLNVLANPHDTESLFVVLSGDVLPLSSTDLLHLATNDVDNPERPARQNLSKGLLYRDYAPKEQSKLLAHAYAVLNRAWDKLGIVEPGRLFLETVIESGWLTRLEARGAEGQAQAADILKFARLITEKARENGYDMARCAQAMDDAARLGGEKPGALSTNETNAVRIMTAHSSKGLEFPIVAVTNCYETRSSNNSLHMLADNGTVFAALSPSGIKTGEYDEAPIRDARDQLEHLCAIKHLDDEREYEEKKRLFYVAATRASAGLIVCMTHERTRNNVYKQVKSDILQGLFPGEPEFPSSSCTVEYGGSEPLQFTRITPQGDADAEDAQEATDAEQADVAPTQKEPVLIPRFSFPEPPRTTPMSLRNDFFSYSSIAPEGSHGVMREDDEPAPAPQATALEEEGANQPASDADKATSFGSALHMTCEWLALQAEQPAEEDIACAIDKFAATWGVSNLDRLSSAFARWEASSIRQQAFSFTNHCPEVPFSTRVGDKVLEGEIDLLCYDDPTSHAFIVDYKTGGSPRESADALHEKHLLQAQCYAYAALKAGYASVEAHFVRVEQEDPAHPGQPQEVAYHFDSSETDALFEAIAQ